MSNLPQSLFLKGVFLKDIVTMDSLFDEQDEKSDNIQSINTTFYEDDIIYDKIPKTFVNTYEWPKTTNIKCIHCAFDIMGVPVPIPVSADLDKAGNRVFDVRELGCGFSCAARRIVDNTRNSSTRWQRLTMLKLIRGIFNRELNIQESIDQKFGLKSTNQTINDLCTDIPLAPERRDICHFGGDISQKEFKHMIDNLETKQYKDNFSKVNID
jgi:hypothetical protein